MSGWDGKTKGPLIGYKIFVLILKTFGLGFSYFLLKIVSYYYFLFEKEKKNIMIDFYRRTLKYSHNEARKLTRKNFYSLGQSLVDGVAFLVGKGSMFTHSFNGEEYLLDIKNGNRGGILLSEIGRASCRERV